VLPGIRLERIVDLSPAIVAPAFTDPVLVEGWLHPFVRLVEDGSADPVVTAGAPWSVEVDSPELGSLHIELRGEEGGARGSITRILIEELALESEKDRLDAIALWNTRLDQLENLLRGHPVRWNSWQDDHGAAYERYRAAAEVAPSAS
jgi:uncharacterized protein YndB with AHSA1/START domain